MRYQGKLTNWNDDKGFGFVEPNGGGNRAFVHIKSFTRRSRRPVNGDLITYSEIQQSQNKYKAEKISLVSDRQLHKKPVKKTRKLGAIVTSLFCVSLAFITFIGKLPVEVLLLYVITSFFAFILYWVDKSAAQNNRWRTPESHLHLLSIIGGWAGAFYAQNKLRHKSRKREFKHVYWVTVAINLCGFFWLFSEQGQQLLSVIL